MPTEDLGREADGQPRRPGEVSGLIYLPAGYDQSRSTSASALPAESSSRLGGGKNWGVRWAYRDPENLRVPASTVVRSGVVESVVLPLCSLQPSGSLWPCDLPGGTSSMYPAKVNVKVNIAVDGVRGEEIVMQMFQKIR
jgi:hypothetical protein